MIPSKCLKGKKKFHFGHRPCPVIPVEVWIQIQRKEPKFNAYILAQCEQRKHDYEVKEKKLKLKKFQKNLKSRLSTSAKKEKALCKSSPKKSILFPPSSTSSFQEELDEEIEPEDNRLFTPQLPYHEYYENDTDFNEDESYNDKCSPRPSLSLSKLASNKPKTINTEDKTDLITFSGHHLLLKAAKRLMRSKMSK